MNDINTLIKHLLDRGESLSTAESCTGGLLAGAITDVPGVSGCYKGGAVSYANEIKHKILGVRNETLSSFGAVSEECAREMALGANLRFNTDLSIVTTGIAGPGGGTPDKPVGLVYIGIAYKGEAYVYKNIFNGDRASVRAQTVATALSLAVRLMSERM